MALSTRLDGTLLWRLWRLCLWWPTIPVGCRAEHSTVKVLVPTPVWLVLRQRMALLISQGSRCLLVQLHHPQPTRRLPLELLSPAVDLRGYNTRPPLDISAVFFLSFPPQPNSHYHTTLTPVVHSFTNAPNSLAATTLFQAPYF